MQNNFNNNKSATNKVEVLAPAGSPEAVRAAVNAGADAVYLGYGKLNARRNAKNFTEEEFFECVGFCKERGVKVNLALNTIAYDRELGTAIETIEIAAKAGVDALIVQDMGIVQLCKEVCPDMPLHASTQLTVHNVSGAKLMKELGFSRVVLAREMSKEEIKAVVDSVDIETEVFVHGALCMCVSGQCYMSSMIGERSGNRGLCAQTCRLPFAASDKSDNSKAKNSSILSLKDLSIVNKLRELRDIGVTSFKIEGRMKRPEYVYSAVEACRNSLSGIPVNYDVLRSVFSRSGFTDEYYSGKISPNMFGTRLKQDIDSTPKELAKIAPKLQKEFPRVEVSFEFNAKLGEKISLKAIVGENSAIVFGDEPEKAINRSTDEESIMKGLSKLGGTYFKFGYLVCNIDDGLSIPLSHINKLRREALDQIIAMRKSFQPYKVNTAKDINIKKQKGAHEATLRGVFNEPSILNKDIKNEMQYLIIPIEKIGECFAKGILKEEDKQKVVALMPRVVFGDNIKKEDSLLKDILKLGVDKLSTSTTGFIDEGKELGFKIFGDFGLNISNSLSLKQFAKMGLSEAVLSFELSMPRARDIDKSDISTGIIAYGKLPLMVTRNCPLRGARGCKGCSEQNRFIVDRTGAKYNIMCHDKKYTEILNNVPLYLGDKKKDLEAFDFVQMNFTTENAKEALNIIKAFKSGEKLENITRGLYYRNVL